METTDKKTILVTGASGYIASWIVKYLLEEGHTVHGTVRSLNKKEKTEHLQKISENAKGELKLFEADLMKEGSFAEAMKGCDIVMHTASPFIVGNITDPETELIQPAKLGTSNVLNEANNSETVKRVVLTSSVVAIYGDAIDGKHVPNNTFTEEHWNTTSSADHQPYPYSKTVAEKEAWKIADAQDKWVLTTINPGFVFGPSLNKNNQGTSATFIKNLGDGTFKQGMPDLGGVQVDVRDVAQAHILAGFNEKSSGRHITAGSNARFIELANILRDHFGDAYPFPNKVVPKFLIWLMAPRIGFSRKFVSKNVGHKFNADNSYSKEDLGLEYRPLEETLVDHFQQILDDGLIEKK